MGVNARFAKRLRTRLRRTLQGRIRPASAVRDLGCSVPEARAHIEAQFSDGMSWDNWGSVWELDHRIAFCSVDVNDREQLLGVLHYTNLQPLLIGPHHAKTAADLLFLRRAA